MTVKPYPTRIGVFDTETDGTDVENCHIVTAFIGLMDTSTGVIVERWSWLLNTGFDIPQGASDVHGITTERMRAEGTDPKAGIFEIAQRLDIIGRTGTPIVAMNATFDFTLLDRELLRHWPTMRPLMEGEWQWRNVAARTWIEGDDPIDGAVRYYRIKRPIIFDPMVYDRAVDKYRKGTRKLVDLARVYGVPVEANAHDAEADCRMAGRVAIKLLDHSRIAGMSMSEVHEQLMFTHRTNALGLADYWSTGKGGDASWTTQQRAEAIADVRSHAGQWPMHPRPEQEGIPHD